MTTRSVLMDLDSDTESEGTGFTLDVCPRDGSMAASALHDGDKPQCGPRKMSETVRAQRAAQAAETLLGGYLCGSGLTS